MIDTVLAVVSSILAWLLLVPTAYTLSTVFVPGCVDIPLKYRITNIDYKKHETDEKAVKVLTTTETTTTTTTISNKNKWSVSFFEDVDMNLDMDVKSNNMRPLSSAKSFMIVGSDDVNDVDDNMDENEKERRKRKSTHNRNMIITPYLYTLFLKVFYFLIRITSIISPDLILTEACVQVWMK